MAKKKLTEAEELLNNEFFANVIIGNDKELTAEEIDVAEKITARKVKEVKLADLEYPDLHLLIEQRETVQKTRVRLGNQLHAYKNLYGEIPPHKSYLETAYYDECIREANIDKLIKAVVTGNEVAEWMMQNKGIKHITMAKLMSEFNLVEISHGNVRIRQYASEWMSYAGLNKQNRQWISKEEAHKIVTEVCGARGEITNESVINLAARTQWKYMQLYDAAYDVEKGKWDRKKLTAAIAKRPFNGQAQALLFNVIVGQIKLSAKSNADLNEYLYAKLYYERLAKEIEKNDNYEFAEQAKREADKYTGELRELYESGKLCKAHLQMRAMRFAEKILLSHLFEETYRVYGDGEVPADPYPIAHLGHRDRIEPLFPYTRGPRMRTCQPNAE